MNETLHIVAIIETKSGSEERMRELLTSLVEPTRAEPGCLDYRLMEEVDQPGRFIFVEEWTDEKALEAHFASPHMVSSLPELKTLIDGELGIRRLRQKA